MKIEVVERSSDRARDRTHLVRQQVVLRCAADEIASSEFVGDACLQQFRLTGLDVSIFQIGADRG